MCTSDAGRLGKAALDLIGVPFRMHGRDPATGLDCVGVAVAALGMIGRPATPPSNYTLRGGRLEVFDGWAAGCGLVVAALQEAAATGDIVLCAPAPRHFHVMIDAGQVLVHAHLGLRRVVAVPPPIDWPVLRRWRLLDKE